MGLAERQAIKDTESKYVQELKDKIRELSGGAEVPVETDWSSFGTMLAIMNSRFNGFGVIESAVYRICTNGDMGRDAVRDGLKKIVVKNVDAAHRSVTFTGGTLTVHGAYGEGEYVLDTAIIAALEAGL